MTKRDEQDTRYHLTEDGYAATDARANLLPQQRAFVENDFPCCVSPEPGRHPLYTDQASHDLFAERLAERLDDLEHLEACWISEDETKCVCIIGALRAVLPRCGHVEQVGVKGLTRQCLRTVHPSASYKHAFGMV